jgi:hypothetical protein
MTAITTELVVDRSEAILKITTHDPDTALEQRVDYAIETCPSPTCRCNDMSVMRLGAAPGSNPPVEFWLDPFARTARASPDASRTIGAPSSQAIAEAIPADDWNRLRAAYSDAKQRATATADWSRERAVFPFEEVERWGQLVSLRDVLPFMPHFAPPAAGEGRLTIDEQYCVDPRCDCTQTVVRLHTGGPPDPNASTILAEPLVDFDVDWQRNRWSIAGQTRRLTPAEEHLRDQLLAANPDLFAELRRRHDIMRTLYRASAADWRAASRVPLRAPRLGRNEPCHCGSGKKYKRCCGSLA